MSDKPKKKIRLLSRVAGKAVTTKNAPEVIETAKGIDKATKPKKGDPDTKRARVAKKAKVTILPPDQEMFCVIYATHEEVFGNGVKSYMRAFTKPKKMNASTWYELAKSNAYRLLTNAHILKRIDELLEIHINEQMADKELGFVMLQKGNLHAKVSAIQEYNKLRGRIKNKVEHSGSIETLIPDEQYERFIEHTAKRLAEKKAQKS